MTIKTALILIFISVFLISACEVNVNQPNVNTNANLKTNSNVMPNSATSATVEKVHWSVAVCSSRAKTVTISAGANENDSDVFAT